MLKGKKIQTVALTLSMVVGMIIAACLSPSAGPAPTTAEEPAAPVAQTEAKSTLDIVKERGKIICVGRGDLAGFGFVNEEGVFSGFDVDYCKVLAAAIFGDPSKAEIRAATASERFTVLQSGEADVLIRVTTRTMSRETDLGMNFAPTTFYDGQGLLVRKNSGIKTLQDLNGASICVLAGTTTELNMADQMAAAGVSYEPVVFETRDEVATAYDEGRCDAWTTDKSGLASGITTLADPSANEILDLTLSKEPLGPAVRHGDDQWYDLVSWVVYATFTAEEMGINSTNVDSFMDTEDPNIKKLLGLEGEYCAKIGLDNDCFVNVIKQVGNYGEIYNANLGPDTVFNLPRGLNNQYTNGGLIYAPPIR
ncbi:MAG: amino acid ABC transporter substrate-binding protein [Caldilineaceae bacterium]|nr:amino acid ABC transporter substrate-binding protein [Caldilineaceae bacterium]